jgi:aminoglycoside phosphotransferase family enzyme
MEPGGPTLAAKVAFLSTTTAYPEPVKEVVRHETHMSWVFLAGDKVYKLKKPVRFPYLDFSTLGRREAACREELRLNRRFAPDVYLGVVRLTADDKGLSIGGRGATIDWLVVMRRLETPWALDRAIEENRVKTSQLDRVVTTLGQFYRHARRPFVSPAAQLAEWHRNISRDCRVLLDRRFDLPSGLVRNIERAQRRFLERRPGALAQRARERRIVDGHGDRARNTSGSPTGSDHRLPGVQCSARMVDPFDEIAYLSLKRAAPRPLDRRLRSAASRALHDDRAGLFLFYRCHRAALRARLAIAHLLEPNPPTPEKWPQRARAYLKIAGRDAARLDRLLSTPRGR